MIRRLRREAFGLAYLLLSCLRVLAEKKGGARSVPVCSRVRVNLLTLQSSRLLTFPTPYDYGGTTLVLLFPLHGELSPFSAGVETLKPLLKVKIYV